MVLSLFCCELKYTARPPSFPGLAGTGYLADIHSMTAMILQTAMREGFRIRKKKILLIPGRCEEAVPDLRLLDLPGMGGVEVTARLDDERVEDIVKAEGIVLLVLELV